MTHPFLEGRPDQAYSLPLPARYVHTNLIAADWQALARFYETVFGCVRVPPERDLAGPSVAAGTGLPEAHLRGVHLRLPGWGETGPTLEIFTYDQLADRPPAAVNRPGFGHLAFSVADVAAAAAAVLAAGGRPVARSSPWPSRAAAASPGATSPTRRAMCSSCKAGPLGCRARGKN